MTELSIQKINETIEKKVNPVLGRHLGSAYCSAWEGGTAWIRFQGNCSACYAAQDTLEQVVEPILIREFHEIRHVELDDSVPEELLDMAKKLLNGDR